MSETALKFHVEPRQRAALLKALGSHELEQIPLSARYFDTADLLLERNGMALRVRDEGKRHVQTLKATLADTRERFEDEREFDAPAGGVEAAARPERHRASKVGRKLLALLRRHDEPPLVEVWRSDVTRIRSRLELHGAVVEWALDEGQASASGRTGPISELELEFKGGDIAGLYAVASDWQARHGLWLDAVSKAERGALLRRNRAFADPVKTEAPQWSAREAATLSDTGLLQRMVASSLQQIRPNASELARGSQDPGHVHQLRVGLRRLRVAARAMQPFAHALPPDWEEGVKPLFDALGQARDAYVFATTLAPCLLRAGAPGVPGEDASAEHLAHAAQLVRGAAFQHTLAGLMAIAYVEAGGASGSSAPGHGSPAMTHVHKTLRRLWRKVLQDAKGFDELPFDRQHRVRKRLKRLRYLAEFAAPWFEPRDVKAWLAQVRPAQDALGHHIDRGQAAARLEPAAATQPAAGFAVGWLRAKSDQSAVDSLRALRRMSHATPFW